MSAAALCVGSLSDLNSTYAILSGSGAVAAVKMAAADFMKEHPDIPVDVLVSDCQLKSDLGLGIARGWFDTQSVDCIADIPLSAMALGLTTLTKERIKALMMTSTAHR
jgi:branched-chain amino acid transport system substrate-binding protein